MTLKEFTFFLYPVACGLCHCSVQCRCLPCIVFFTEFKWHHLPCPECPFSRISVLVNSPARVNEWGVYFLTTASSTCKCEVPYHLRMSFPSFLILIYFWLKYNYSTFFFPFPPLAPLMSPPSNSFSVPLTSKLAATSFLVIVLACICTHK